MTAPNPARTALPAGVWVLGFVSLLMDISSEMVHALLPMFLVGTLGVSVLAVGLACRRAGSPGHRERTPGWTGLALP